MFFETIRSIRQAVSKLTEERDEILESRAIMECKIAENGEEYKGNNQTHSTSFTLKIDNAHLQKIKILTQNKISKQNIAQIFGRYFKYDRRMRV